MSLIVYDSLVDEYNQDLANVLRGFKPKYDFLELWVPDANHQRSIFNLVESAQAMGKVDLSLLLSDQVVETMDLENLVEELGELGNITTKKNKDGLCLEVSALNNEAEITKSVVKDIEQLNPIYLKKISELALSRKYFGSVEEDNSLCIIRANCEGVSLFATVDPNSHIIKSVSYAGVENEVQQALLEGLCQIVDGLPIQEASDHGVIKLEYLLRDKEQKLNISGIINLFNIDPIFKLPLTLVRGLIKMYREKQNFEQTSNFYDERPGKVWLESSSNERKERLQITLNRFLCEFNMNENDIIVISVEKSTKANLLFNIEMPSTEKSKLLMALEKKIRQFIDCRIELYQEAWKDRNTIRRL